MAAKKESSEALEVLESVEGDISVDPVTGAVSFTIPSAKILMTLRRPLVADWIAYEQFGLKNPEACNIASAIHFAQVLCTKFGTHPRVSEASLQALELDDFIILTKAIATFKPKSLPKGIEL